MAEFVPVEHDPFVADAGTALAHAANDVSGIPDRGQPTFTASDSMSRFYDVWKRGSDKYAGMVDNPLDISRLGETWQKQPGLDLFGGFGPADIGIAGPIRNAARAARSATTRTTSEDATKIALRAIEEALRLPPAETMARAGTAAATREVSPQGFGWHYMGWPQESGSQGRWVLREMDEGGWPIHGTQDRGVASVEPIGTQGFRVHVGDLSQIARTLEEAQEIARRAAPGNIAERQAAGIVSSHDPANIAETLRRRTDESKLIRDWLGVEPNRFRGEVTTNPPSISGHILDENGQSIATIDRNLRGDKAHHGYFHLNTSRQGADFGKNLLRSNIDFYRNRGVKTVDLLANLDVGGYAWAKYGFVPTQESWNVLRRRLLRSLDAPAANASALPGYSQAKRILQDSDPKSIWALSDMKLPTNFVGRDGKPLSFGKWLLLGTRWDGELNLNHAGAMERFDSYVSPKK